MVMLCILNLFNIVIVTVTYKLLSYPVRRLSIFASLINCTLDRTGKNNRSERPFQGRIHPKKILMEHVNLDYSRAALINTGSKGRNGWSQVRIESDTSCLIQE